MSLSEYFDNEGGITPEGGYVERPVAWFEQHILPDFRSVKARLGLGPTLLDIGCAYGYFTVRYARMFVQVLGIDFSQRRIAVAKELNQAPNIRYLCVDITDPFVQAPGPAKIDSAVSSAVFQHIPPDKRVAAFHNVAAVLKENAFLVLYDEDWQDRPCRWGGIYEPLSPAWLQDYVRSFEVVDKEFIAVGNHGERVYRYELRKT